MKKLLVGFFILGLALLGCTTLQEPESVPDPTLRTIAHEKWAVVYFGDVTFSFFKGTTKCSLNVVYFDGDGGPKVTESIEEVEVGDKISIDMAVGLCKNDSVEIFYIDGGDVHAITAD